MITGILCIQDTIILIFTRILQMQKTTKKIHQAKIQIHLVKIMVALLTSTLKLSTNLSKLGIPMSSTDTKICLKISSISQCTVMSISHTIILMSTIGKTPLHKLQTNSTNLSTTGFQTIIISQRLFMSTSNTITIGVAPRSILWTSLSQCSTTTAIQSVTKKCILSSPYIMKKTCTSTQIITMRRC